MGHKPDEIPYEIWSEAEQHWDGSEFVPKHNSENSEVCMRYFKKIIGKRIYLSPINKDDAETYTKWMNDYDVAAGLGSYRQLISIEAERKILDSFAIEGHN